MMKKTYINPTMNVVKLSYEPQLMAGSFSYKSFHFETKDKDVDGSDGSVDLFEEDPDDDYVL